VATMSQVDGLVTVDGTLVEPAAIAGWIADEAHQRVAEAVTLTIDGLANDGRELNQIQRID